MKNSNNQVYLISDEQINHIIHKAIKDIIPEIRVKIDNSNSPNKLPVPAKPTLYTKEEVANMLKISESTLNSWMRKGKIGYEKFGRGVRFSQSDIESAKIQSKAH